MKLMNGNGELRNLLLEYNNLILELYDLILESRHQDIKKFSLRFWGQLVNFLLFFFIKSSLS